MKELSIEEKAKRYDEAIKVAADIKAGTATYITDGTPVVDAIFPELKESEDEKVRKTLIDYFKNYKTQEDIGIKTFFGIPTDDIIAWLEKVGEIVDYYEDKLDKCACDYFINKGYKKALEKKGGITKLSEEEQNRFAKGVLTSCAMSFIDYLDAHKYEGKMCVSNGECEYIENAFQNAMWDRLHRYYCKYIEKQGEHLENYNEAEKEKAEFVGDGFIECHADFLDFKEGNTYWLEYIGDDKYNVRSDNLLGKTYHITPCQLYTVFKKLTWLEKQVSQDNAEDIDILHRFSFYSYKDEPNVLYLSGVYVNEECRNKGIGTKILEVADEVAKRLNCHTIRLKTKKDSNAERLYRTHGYNSLATEERDEIWLEKQNKQNPNPCDGCVNRKGCINCENGELREVEQNPADNIEPKFHKGEWITNGDYTWKIVEVKPLDYILQSQDGNTVDDTISYVDKHFHSFTIEDVKDGYVLVDSLGNVCIYQEPSTKLMYHSYCYGNHKCFIDMGGSHEIVGSYPATKEQRDTLLKAMTDAGYTFDFEKKELKKIEQPKLTEFEDAIKDMMDDYRDAIDDNDATVEEVKEKAAYLLSLISCKPAWSEEDEKMFDYALDMIEWYSGKNEDKSRLVSDWLKSLKDRVQPRQEWDDTEIAPPIDSDVCG